MRKFFFYFFTPVFLFSCSNGNDGTKVPDSVKADRIPVVVLSDWHSLTDSWTAALNLRNAAIMKSFYGDSVIYYGDKISGDDVVRRQQEYFAANIDYHQKITDYMGEEQQPDGNWRVRITKQVTAGGKTVDYPASLIYAKKNGIWKIISESDDITDLKKGTPLTLHYEPEIITVEGLLKEVKSNKGMYFALWPSQPLNVVATPAQEKEGNVTEKNVDRIQLNGDEKQLQALLNKKVQISGTLFHSHSSYHFTTVLMNVTAVSAVDQSL
ncbi:hypothetical protein BH11BAC7_BH11BAC7_21120 [soil metagenome]